MEINLLTKTTPTKGLIFNIQKFSLNDGPGIRTVIFFKGCPLRCKWCSNPESQSRLPEPMFDEKQNAEITVGKYWTVEQLMKIILQDQPFYEESGGGVTFSGARFFFKHLLQLNWLRPLNQLGLIWLVRPKGMQAAKFLNHLCTTLILCITTVNNGIQPSIVKARVAVTKSSSKTWSQPSKRTLTSTSEFQ